MSVDSVRDIGDILKDEERLRIEKALSIKNALNSNDVNDIYKAQKYLKSIEATKDDFGGRSMLVDPQSQYVNHGYRDKPLTLSFDVLRGMGNTDIIRAIRKTRKSQVYNFLKPQKDKYSTGFVVEKKKKYTQQKEDKKLTKEEEKKVEYIISFLLDCGISNNKWHGDTFQTFVGKLIDDSLQLDQACAEVVRNRKGEPIEFFAVDGATIRLAETYWGDPEGKYSDLQINGYYPSYVQLYQQKVINQYYPWELLFGVRNPTTDIRQNGYGESELERMIQTVTAILNSSQYNANFFKVGSAPKGILRYSGNINQNTVEEFKRQWQATLAGVDNMHKMAVINADKMDFINTQMSNKDMEFGKFQDFLIKIACAIFLIDPAEIGFPMQGNSDGSGGAMFEGSNEQRLKWSKDKGLKPLLESLAFWLNKYIVSEIDPDYELRFVGIDDEFDAAKELDADIKMIQNFKTPNEIRAARNLDPIEGGDIILNPVFMQARQMQMMGNPESNSVVDQMDGQNEDGEENPFMESLKKSLEESLG